MTLVTVRSSAVVLGFGISDRNARGDRQLAARAKAA
jgi:hypothetical protein